MIDILTLRGPPRDERLVEKLVQVFLRLSDLLEAASRSRFINFRLSQMKSRFDSVQIMLKLFHPISGVKPPHRKLRSSDLQLLSSCFRRDLPLIYLIPQSLFEIIIISGVACVVIAVVDTFCKFFCCGASFLFMFQE